MRYHDRKGFDAVTIIPPGILSPVPISTMSANQVDAVESIRVQANLPGAQDIEAMDNRNVTLEYLYRISGRTNHIYTGLWQEYQQRLARANKTL